MNNNNYFNNLKITVLYIHTMLDQIIECFKNEPQSILSAKNISKKLNIRRKRISVVLNTRQEFQPTVFNDTGSGKYRTNTFKLVV
jgi:hypothetical protein